MTDEVFDAARWTGSGSLFRRLHVARRQETDPMAEREVCAAARLEQGNGARHADLDELATQEEVGLVQRVFLAPGTTRRAVLFSGVDRDNGCGPICLRAGQTLARLVPQSVCVIESDLRTPALHQLAGTEPRDGFAAAVEHPRAAPTFAEQLSPGNLWLLPSAPASEPRRLLTVDRVRPCLHALGAHFDRVLIHAAPINLFAESLALAPFVDGVLLILEANVTRRETVRHVKARLDDLHVPLIGVVLNNRTFPIPDVLYRLL